MSADHLIATTEDSTATRQLARPLTGAEYLASLRDDREIWIYGQRVDDVTTHPAFRNTARMLARFYDALHDPARRAVVTRATDTDSGGYTHRFFRCSRTADELAAARDAVAETARISYGWLGRTPDYKGSFIGTMGAYPEYYAPFEANARRWYRVCQEDAAFVNHAVINPHIDRDKPPEAVKDAFMHVVHESDAGLVISGAKVVATASSLTHHTLVVCNGPVKSPDFSFVCLVPTGSPGVKLICRTSYEMSAAACGTPFDYPLSSRLDENDSILVFDRVLVPWENVLAHGISGPIGVPYQESGFQPHARLHACTRLAVKLDFVCGLLMKAADATGGRVARDIKVQVGEVLAWRHLFWALSDAMVHHPVPWANGHVLPNPDYALSFRVMANALYPKIREVGQKILANAAGLAHLEWPADVDRLPGGSRSSVARERRQVIALLWDAIGSEFATRHELFERTHLGSYDSVRLEVLVAADSDGTSAGLRATVERCMAEYDSKGWTAADLIAPTKQVERA